MKAVEEVKMTDQIIGQKIKREDLLPVRLWLMTTDMAGALDPAMLSALMPKRVSKAARFRFEKDRLLSLAAGYMMMRAPGLKSEDDLLVTENGKPYASGYPAFNVSHSGELAVLAIADGADSAMQGTDISLGVDVEQIKKRNMSVAKRAFTERERTWMNAVSDVTDPEEERSLRFHRLWTLKESVMKATGLGFQMDMLSFEVLEAVDGVPIKIGEENCYMTSLRKDEYMISVCCNVPFFLEQGFSDDCFL